MILKLIFMFLKVGFLGFGGGYAMLSLIYSESLGLGLTNAQFADLNVLDFLIPGPIAINSATYVGYILSYQTYGYILMALLGATIATITVTIPSYIYAPVFLKYEEKIQKNKVLNEMLTSVKGAAVGLVIAVSFNVFIEAVFNLTSLTNFSEFNPNYLYLGLAILSFILHERFKINPIILTIGAFVIGFASYYLL